MRARGLGPETIEPLVDNLPDNVHTIDVRLRYRLPRKWLFSDYVISVNVEWRLPRQTWSAIRGREPVSRRLGF